MESEQCDNVQDSADSQDTNDPHKNVITTETKISISQCYVPSSGESTKIANTVESESVFFSSEATQRVQQPSSECESQPSFSGQPIPGSEPRFQGIAGFSFDPHDNTNITKRGPGRPRKDGKSPAQHKKIKKRGPGRPRKEDGSSLLHHKMFPGRSRIKTRKMHRHLIVTPGSHIMRSLSPKDEMESNKEIALHSGDASGEMSSILPEKSLSVKFNAVTWPRRVCSFCNLPETSCLGQGYLRTFEPTPGYVPCKPEIQTTCSKDKHFNQIEERRSHLKLSFRKHKSFKTGRDRMKLQRHKPFQNLYEKTNFLPGPMDELSVIGFTVSPDIKDVFQATGHILAHFNCAVWSESVSEVESSLLNVDKAVVSGIVQKCSRCRKFGATVHCKVSDCSKVYHYPCAIISGAFLNIRTFRIVCAAHLSQTTDIDSWCVVCQTMGELTELLLCTACYNLYHGSCLDPPVDVSPIVRAGWQCADCKICQTCRQPGDDNKMLVCDTCDKGFHTFCLKPMIISVPKSGWKCHNCRICGDCGARTPGSGPSSRWHLNYSVCDSCYQQRNKGVACPLCGKAYRQFSQRKEMRHCAICRKFIHVECDRRAINIKDAEDYVCPVCINPIQGVIHQEGCTGDIPLKGKIHDALPAAPDIFFNSSRESFGSPNEDSLSSAESDSTSADIGGVCDVASPPDQLTSSISSVLSCPEQSSSRYAHHREFPLGYKIPVRKRLGVGRPKGGGKLAGKRRAKTAEFRRKRGPKPKIKSFAISGALCLQSPLGDSKEYKQDDEPTADNKMVLSSATDEFVLCQDLCVMCGSFGKGEEGRLVACSQCGQCYHSYCAGIKVTAVVLKKGWRCLDCTVCEGCGQPHDEGRLLLCDECDISFHIYCLDPPLEDVPQGNWKCKWCVICVKCGSKVPGYNCKWQLNYTHCGPCASYSICSVCAQNYEENDLIIQCVQCERWLHGKCDQIENEESAEKCADYGYICVQCRPKEDPPPHLLPPSTPPPSPPAPIIEKPVSPVPKAKEPEVPAKSKPQTQFFLDGVCLSENGMQHIKSLTPEQPKKSRARRPRQPSVGSVLVNPVVVRYPSLSILDRFDETDTLALCMQGCGDNTVEAKNDTEIKQEGEDEAKACNADLFRECSTDGLGEKKKRQRKMHKLGIGGFVVKPRGRSSSTKETSGEQTESISEVAQSSETALIIGAENVEHLGQDKPKRRRRIKKKTPLEDSFPGYLQEAFFGKDLLQSSRENGQSWDVASKEDLSVDDTVISHDKTISCELSKVNPSASQDLNFTTSNESASLRLPDDGIKIRTAPVSSQDDQASTSKDVSIEDVNDLLSLSQDISSQDNLVNVLSSNKELTGRTLEGKEIKTENQREKEKSSVINFDTVLASNSKMNAVLEESGLPQMDSKDIEDVFEGVLRDQKMTHQSSHIRLKETLSSRSSFFPDCPISVSSLQASTSYTVQTSGSQNSPLHQDSVSQQAETSGSWLESECDHSQVQKNILKWETDEALGAFSTISPVLYANINFPNLKMEFPSWSDRSKQIAKIWRSLPSEKRQPYLQKARENRAASRTNKTSIETDRSSKEHKSQEVDQEKQWKQFQAMRLMQQQKQQKILQTFQINSVTKAQQMEKTEVIPTYVDADKAQKVCQPRSVSDNSPIPRNEIALEQGSCPKDPIANKLFIKKWNLESAVQKTGEPISAPQCLPQSTSSTLDTSAGLVRSAVPARASSTSLTSPFIQVSRVRPPIDPNRIPVCDSSTALQSVSSSGSNTDPYHPSQSLLVGHNAPPQQRSSYSPTSLAPRQSLLISRSEISRAPTPTLSKEILYTPPSTPRPQSSDSFFQVSVSPRTQFLVSLDSHSQPSLTTHKMATCPSPFQSSSLDPSSYSAASNISESVCTASSSSSQAADVSSSKPFYSQPSASAMLQDKTHHQPPLTSAMSASESRTKAASSLSIMAPSDHYGPQLTVQDNPVDHTVALPKTVLHNTDDHYTTMPPALRTGTVVSQERTIHQPGLHAFKEGQGVNSDRSNIISRQQLRDLLQKQQAKEHEETLGGKDAPQTSLHSWQQGIYNPGSLQYLSKDDCFRHPYPPAVRARNLSDGQPIGWKTFPNGREAIAASKAIQRDIKVEHPQDIPGTSMDIKVSSPIIDASVESTASHHSNNNLISVGLSSSQSADTTHKTTIVPEHLEVSPTPNKIETPEKAGQISCDNLTLIDSCTDMKSVEKKKEVNPKDLQPVADISQHRENIDKSSFLTVEAKAVVSPQGISSPDPGKKRKTTAGDLVKDLEAQPGEHDVVTSDGCEELDDDELLGLGNDFNILEYADPELDKGLVGEGEKSNILDEHLDLDDKDDELDEDEEDIKARSGSEEKDLLSDRVSNEDKKNFPSSKGNKNEKNTLKCEPPDLQDEFLSFDKKVENKDSFDANSYKLKSEQNVVKENNPETVRIPKKEPKLSAFSSCSVSGSSYCSQDEIDLKPDKMTIKESAILPQASHSFNSPLPLPSHQPAPAYPQDIPPPPSYRMGNTVKQTLTAPNPHLPQNQLISEQHKTVFPMHVGVSLRPNIPLVQQNIISTSQQTKPLLLQEQPLLLEDLVEQEKREQRRQTQEGLISPQGDALLSDIDFERLKDDVFSGPPDDSIGGPGSLLSSHEPSLQTVVSPNASVTAANSASSHNFGPPPYSLIWHGQEHNISCSGATRTPTMMHSVQPKSQVSSVVNSLGLPSAILLPGDPSLRAGQPQKSPIVAGAISNHPFYSTFLPTPPTPPLDPLTEQEKQQQVQYEKWLVQQQSVLSSQQKYLETEVVKLRKVKKALNAKQRQLRKNGTELAENDAVELAKICQEQAGLQKQLDQVRKQSRQHTMLLQEYRLKQQKRQQQQQQQQQQISQPSVHTTISSLQSSPQNSHSPHQIGQAAPPSPLLPSSPLGPSASRIQHSPSPLMHHSPAAVSPSTVIQQTSPLVHSHMLSQQMSLHFPVAKHEGKAWCSQLQVSQITDDSIPFSERFQQQREHIEKFQTAQPPPPPPPPVPASNSSMTVLSEKDSKDGTDIKQKPDQELVYAKRNFPEQTDFPSTLPSVTDEQNPTLKTPKVETGQKNSPKEEATLDTSSSVPQSVLTQSLPSSVTNTLNFTLRQTGMPTVCLPSNDQNLTELPSQVHYLGLSPAEKSTSTDQKIVTSEINEPRSETSGKDVKFCTESFISSSDSELRGLQETKIEGTELLASNKERCIPHQVSLPSEVSMHSTDHNRTLNSKVSDQSQYNFSISLKDETRKNELVLTDHSTLTSSHTDLKTVENITQEVKPSITLASEATAVPLQKTDSRDPLNLPSSASSHQEPGESNNENNNVNKKEDEENETFIARVKLEFDPFEESKQDCANQQKDPRGCPNDAPSSDEEVDNLTKVADEGEPDPGKQNVLLKQLLQNCPSAETPRKSNSFPELKKEEVKGDDTPFEFNKDAKEKRTDEMKTKKPSYLDIRRAQLEKEPTPPPEEIKPKRKRSKKKKPDIKDGSPIKKRCRKGSTSKVEEGYEAYIETLMTQLTNLPPLRILEPHIKPNFNVLAVYGCGDLNVAESQLKGSYGNASVSNQCDMYSYYPFSKNHPTPSASIPPSSPPYRGFYNQEFSVPSKAQGKNDTSSNVLMPPPHVESQKVFRDAESPDTVISSSSPECCLLEPLCKWPELLIIDDGNSHSLEDKKAYSPVIPLITPIPIRVVPSSWNDTPLSLLSDFDEEKDKENIPRIENKSDIHMLKSKITGLGGYSSPLKDSGNVAVTLTLSSAAAEDICGVLSALADLLKIPIPATYDIVERTATPPSQKLGLYRKSKNSDINIHSLLNGKPRFCRHCDIVVLSAGIRKKASDLTCISKEEQEEDEVIFCSTNCYMQFALTHRSSGSEEKEAAAVVSHPGDSEKISKSKQNLLQNIETGVKSSLGTEPNPTETAGNLKIKYANEDKEKYDDQATTPLTEEEINSEIIGDNIIFPDESSLVKNENSLEEKHNYKETHSEISSNSLTTEKQKRSDNHQQGSSTRKWKWVKYKYWTQSCTTPPRYKVSKEDKMEQTSDSFYFTIKPEKMPNDGRKCIFCYNVGDGDTDASARLLNIDVDKWVHLNCALWSAEVYETVNGALMNVETAYKRSVLLICCFCHKQGASLKCFKVRCPNIYHFSCAMKDHCVFFKDKTVLCSQHVARGNAENELDSVAVYRRVYVNRDEHKQVASMIQGDQYVMRIGSLVFLNIGQLLPHQIQAFHTPNCIYPVGYKVIRMYWSMRKLGRRCQYICSINEVNGKPEFHIQVKEHEYNDITIKDTTAKGVWQKVIYPIEKMRRQAQTIKIFPDFISGDDLFGLTEPAVLRIVESLPGVDTLNDYNFRYGRSPFLELPLAINPTGCARSEPKLRTHFKRPHTLHTSNTSRSSFHSTFGGIEVSSPYIKQFVHSKSSQYRKMKTDWRNNVYLARSRIQGLGLYAARDIEKHTMVIEYIGQLIRNEIAERNEAIYEAQNRGVYMFRLDENRVIDATLCGGLARYMNHSCNPNCVAEVVQIDRENKILIIANRRITRGEELTYDYKFEVEDDQHKISCLCGAPNCRKWMN